MDVYNSETDKIYANCITPVFIMTMEMSEKNKNETDNYIKLLERTSKKYSNFMLFTYGNYSDNSFDSIRESFNKVPGAILRFTDKSYIEYPKDWVFDDAHIDKFVELYLRKKLNKIKNSNNIQMITHKVYRELSAVKILQSIELNTEHLTFVFFFSSTEQSLEFIQYLNEIDKNMLPSKSTDLLKLSAISKSLN